MSSRPRKKRAEPSDPPPTERRRVRLAAPTPQPKIPNRRSVAIGMGSVVSILLLMALLVAWGGGMTFILLFGDRMSEKLIIQNSEMQDSYEQRLQGYRAEIARLTLEIEQSRFDQTSVEGRVVEMGRRQRQIEARLAALKRLSDLVGSAPGAPTLTPAPATTPTPNRTSFTDPSDGLIWREGPWGGAPLLEDAQLGAPPVVEEAPSNQVSAEVEAFILRLDRAIINADQTQTLILQNLGRSFETRVDRTRGAMQMLGLSPEAVIQWRGRNDTVLPNIVLPLSDQQTPFGLGIGRVRQNFAILQGFRPLVETLPVTRPTGTDVRYSSGFGYRSHPLTRTRKFHAGIDMAAPIGTTVRASGSGTVVSAGWGGGYGNLVQIDHGNGLITRYAHLSRIDVSPQQPIGRGQLVGLMGSTGASTGSHLHFETRIKGNPVNPACFMRAGDRMSGGQSIPYECEQPPSWTIGGSQEAEDDDS